jgi:uncharacterized protein YprB with RNaseH-like and TPR domain
MSTKYCYYGDHDVPVEDFYRDASKADGLMNRCKACDNIYREKKRAQQAVIKKSQRVIVLDVETSPNVAYTFRLWNTTISPESIEEPVRIISFAASWLDGKEIRFYSEHHNGREAMVEALWAILEEADAVVSYNGVSFDEKLIRAEFLKAGLPPTIPWVSLDLLKTVRKTFKFPSHRLNYICKALDLGGKINNGGFQLWIDCMKGDKEAWETMRSYNIQDVKLTKQLYFELLPWMDTKLNAGHFATQTAHPTCPACGSQDLDLLSQPHRTPVSEFAQYRCNDCGKVSRARKRNKTPDSGVLR